VLTVCGMKILKSLFPQEKMKKFRNNIIPIGVTSMSAGSKTNPGGYVVDPQSLEQFEISDERSAEEIAQIITNSGYEPVWKDWDKCYG